MQKILTINGINFNVDYNGNLYTQHEVEGFLKRACKSEKKLNEIMSEIEILNYNAVIPQLKMLWNSGQQISTRVVDCSKLVTGPFATMGLDVKKVLIITYKLKIIKDLGNNTYELEGTDKNFKNLYKILK